MKAKYLAAGCLFFAAVAAHSAPLKKYFAVLYDAKVIPSPYWEHSIAFEVDMETVTPNGEHKILQLSESEGRQVMLEPGEYYRVTEYGGGSARLDYLNPGEKQELFIKQMKWKAKR